MGILLGLVLLSWFLTSIFYIPFIRFLYKMRFQRMKQKTLDAFNNRTPIFDRFNQKKAGTPVGGGVLVIIMTSVMLLVTLALLRYFWVPVTSVFALGSEVKILLFTFISFGALGFLDDAKKTFSQSNGKFFGLRLRHKLILEIILAGIIGYWMVSELRIDMLYMQPFGIIRLGWWFIPFAVFTVIAFANAFNITDGLDGLSSGLLMIALGAFWIISASILDTPLSIFLALWIGSLIAFIYFNIYPARIIMGDVGSLSFGATMAVVGLIIGKAPVLVIIGGIFVLEATSSLVQLLAKKYFHRKVFAVAPLHLWLQYYGWPEPKIVMRFWILAIVLAVFGLWLAFTF
ncbi:hypothetical protein A2Z33_04820 [Candidatus Gottesmanbacteria bacterium RBG_16_52_11]|uniref:Phospho-N-acetylmuramoyl-pentapeptide-transferase n=1 Tax=Candidatus Gottesmanbacteria bacterium RBG_16_52_11 TaxID=1798374 RepID=A0A1F5YU84_9BACT|nr:MAG: hypothetical protein A2Z33_04820 [Candidatus Gottesmanbacteria bacterium RBG_16_52_11]